MSSKNTSFDGAKLKALRMAAGLTQEELSHLLGVTRETIGHIENNRPSSINALTLNAVTKWAVVCNERADATQKNQFIQYLTDFVRAKIGI